MVAKYFARRGRSQAAGKRCLDLSAGCRFVGAFALTLTLTISLTPTLTLLDGLVQSAVCAVPTD